MAEYDLTRTIIPYLDRHLVFPLLTHLHESGLFTPEQVAAAQYELAKGTNMVDYIVSLYEQLNPNSEVPQEFAAKREKAVAINEQLQQEAQAVLDVIENPDVAQALRQDKNQNLTYLKDNYGLTLEQITALYNFGKFQYTYGNYSGAADYLYHFRVLSTDTDLNTSAHWGKLASDILTGKWDVALEELNTLRETLDTRAGAAPITSSAAGATPSSHVEPPLGTLHSRTWLVHWSLFVYFNHPAGRTLLLETFLAPAYLNTIQSAAPWVLRYLAVAAVLSRRSQAASAAGATPVSSRVRHAIREVVKVVQLEEYQYSDPVTKFLKELYVEFDFEAAQRQLQLAERVVANDFFLSETREEFLDNARYLISEAYCRIHQRIDIADLSARLNLSPDEGEKWIVNLIRDTRMAADAKIDLEKNVIEIHRPALPIYQSVIEKTRGLSIRSQALGAALSRTGQQQQQAQPAQEQSAVVEGAR
ncbi:eukaryotic translation initiation factor 3 subunit 6 [Russula ochroleuca]|jgi:translation initiation factor 3 subunit E|uniref:Eukaryotic translation initiation factor 3 subunit E n=1 Tax=Russula ochroleuca TaxID=152965 RepID=A0A9P5ML41_9AGAM|nr:eukaryotic translation initiation factor 3 subunit 6 [Russula ochroleuca]